jgi:hypothetical protein
MNVIRDQQKAPILYTTETANTHKGKGEGHWMFKKYYIQARMLKQLDVP